MDVPDDLVSTVTDPLDETPLWTWRRAINDLTGDEEHFRRLTPPGIHSVNPQIR